MFKEKTSKKRNHVVDNSKKNTTLDARHQEMIKEIEKGVIEKEKLKEKKTRYITQNIYLERQDKEYSQ